MLINIKSYKEGITNFNALKLEVSHNKYRKAMEVTVVPVEIKDYGYSQIYDFSRNPLTEGFTLASIPMPRKNQKRIDAAQKDLDGMAQKIANLWDARDFDTIKAMFA